MHVISLTRAIVLGFGLFVSGCAHQPPVIGALYTDVLYAQTGTANQTGNRVGEACANSYLGLFATGDASLEAARRNGGITLISSVDRSHESILGFLYIKNCTIARGR